ncbi:MAG: hypothetical protein LBM96_04865 [Methanobrevibacter sp.]|jgi:predicted transport protein|nr:hypothetical protein [Candidatus Methanoflexus mossambicus]
MVLSNNNLTQINKTAIGKENPLHNLISENLGSIFGLECIKNEFTIEDLRIDTLAYDKKNKSFVIIEYKTKKNHDVFAQIFAYLSALKKKKTHFVLEYNKKNKCNFSVDDFNFQQPKLIIISSDFTKHQKKGSEEFEGINIELWEVKRYTHKILLLNNLSNNDVKIFQENIKKDITNSELKQSLEDIKKEFHSSNLKNLEKDISDIKKVIKKESCSSNTKNLEKDISDLKKDIKTIMEILKQDTPLTPETPIEIYKKLKEEILTFEGVKLKKTEYYDKFSYNNVDFIRLQHHNDKLKVILKKTENQKLDDEKMLFKYKPEQNWGKNWHVNDVYDSSNFDYIINLIKQAYENTKRD